MSFNQELVARIVGYYKKTCGEDISFAESTERLQSLADLYESFIEFVNFDED